MPDAEANEEEGTGVDRACSDEASCDVGDESVHVHDPGDGRESMSCSE